MIRWTIGEYASMMTLISHMNKANKKPYEHIQETKIHYGDHKDQHLLLFEPKTVRSKKKFIFFIHGGGWSMNNPDTFRFVGNFFADCGYLTVSAGYRYVPEFRYPSQIEDVFSALKRSLKIMDDQFPDIREVIVIGSSAGAHLGAFLVYDKERQQRYQIDSSRFKGYISNAGPLSFDACRNATIQKMIRDMMGKHQNFKDGDPMYLLNKQESVPPFPALFIHGDRDPIVEFENSVAFADFLNQKAGRGSAEIVIENGVYHSNLSVYLFTKDLVSRREMMSWLEKREAE